VILYCNVLLCFFYCYSQCLRIAYNNLVADLYLFEVIGILYLNGFFVALRAFQGYRLCFFVN
jgi:hypothetical protein